MTQFEGYDWNGFWATDMENAIKTLPPEMVRCGVTPGGTDLLTWCCSMCPTEEIAFHVAQTLTEMGYTHLRGWRFEYGGVMFSKRWKLFHYLMEKSGAYYSPTSLQICIEHLNQRNIDPFLDRGVVLQTVYPEEYRKFHAFRTAREKARIASIALIGVAKKLPYRSALDVMRVISRVVWSERCDEKWSE